MSKPFLATHVTKRFCKLHSTQTEKWWVGRRCSSRKGQCSCVMSVSGLVATAMFTEIDTLRKKHIAKDSNVKHCLLLWWCSWHQAPIYQSNHRKQPNQHDDDSMTRDVAWSQRGPRQLAIDLPWPRKEELPESRWWFQPNWKILVKLDHFPK